MTKNVTSSNNAQPTKTKGKRSVVDPSVTCSQLRCEECSVELPASREETPVLTAVRAKNAGVWVKNFLIYGDESGYHYFCCPDHGKVWRTKNIPSANVKHIRHYQRGRKGETQEGGES